MSVTRSEGREVLIRADGNAIGLPGRAPRPLPDRPLVSIRPNRKWVALGLRDLWAHRELLYFLAWRDVKVRYKQTLFGAAWAIMQPLFTTVIFTLLFGKLAGVPSDGIPYPLFAYCGLLLWTFFASSVTRSGDSLVGSAHVITKVYFPRMIIPAAAIAAGFVDLSIAFAILLVLMAYHGMAVTWTIVILPALMVLTVLLALGVGMFIAALNVSYRDVRQALPFVIQLWMFVTPIIYPLSLLPAQWRWVLVANPLTGIIEGYRAAAFGHELNWVAIAYSMVITVTVLVASAYVFRRMERSFADIV